jgi:hypothetical protein
MTLRVHVSEIARISLLALERGAAFFEVYTSSLLSGLHILEAPRSSQGSSVLINRKQQMSVTTGVISCILLALPQGCK